MAPSTIRSSVAYIAPAYVGGNTLSPCPPAGWYSVTLRMAAAPLSPNAASILDLVKSVRAINSYSLSLDYARYR